MSSIIINPHLPFDLIKQGTEAATQGNLKIALCCYEKALALDPYCGPAQWSKCLLLLLLGDYSAWAKYDWIDECAPKMGWFKRRLTVPLWHGEPLQGKRLFIYCDEGYGDFIQFLRYLPLIKDGYIVLECPPDIVSLCHHQANEIVLPNEKSAYDLHCPIMLLPRYFGITENYIPNKPYIFPPKSNHLATLLEGWAGFKIGIVFKGNPKHKYDANRSIDPQLFLTLPHNLISLQKGTFQEQMLNLGAIINDWSDTAALIDKVDLVISVDTAVAHLAGAMGKPVWLLVPKFPDWRWQLEREDTPWYPTMRLFRQETSWLKVIDRIKNELSTKNETLPKK